MQRQLLHVDLQNLVCRAVQNLHTDDNLSLGTDNIKIYTREVSGRDSFSYQGAKEWNILVNLIKDAASLK